MTVPNFLTKAEDTLETVETAGTAPVQVAKGPTGPRQTNTIVVVGGIWLILVVWSAFAMANGHRFDFLTFLAVLVIGAASPLLVMWGLVWITAVPSKGDAKQGKVPKVASVIAWAEQNGGKAVFALGVLAVIGAQAVAIVSRSSLSPGHPQYAAGGSVGMSLIKILIYSLLLGLVAVVVGLSKPRANKLLVVAWLLLALGWIDCGFTAFSIYAMPRDPGLMASDGSSPWGGSNAAKFSSLPEESARRMEAAWGLVGKTGREIMAKAAQYAPPTVEGIGTSGNNELYALVNGNIVYEGSTVNGYTVRKIYEDKIEFQKDGTVYTQTME
jgi:hypothetical protein